jgi:hypothetical protein
MPSQINSETLETKHRSLLQLLPTSTKIISLCMQDFDIHDLNNDDV